MVLLLVFMQLTRDLFAIAKFLFFQAGATLTLIVPSTIPVTLGDRAFPMAAARAWNRAGSVSVFGVGIWYFRRYFFMSVRYSVSVFWNTSVFGIGISEILVENRKFLVPANLYLAPLLRVPSEFHSRKLEWWGHQAMKKMIVSLTVSIHQHDKQMDRRTPHDSKDRAMDCDARWTFMHSVIMLIVLIVCICYTLLIDDCLVWSIA